MTTALLTQVLQQKQHDKQNNLATMLPWRLFLLSLAYQSPSSRNGATEQLPNVIVVGAGLAGLAASLGLANTGRYHVDLVEQRLNFNRKGATFGLAPNGVKALEELDPGIDGVMAELRDLGIDFAEGNSRGCMLAWWMMRDALLRRVQANNNKIKLHLGYTVKDIVDEPGTPNLQATFVPSIKTASESAAADAGSTPKEPLTLEGCLLVGSDGAYSTVRDYLGCPPAKRAGTTVWRGNVQLDSSCPMTDEQRDLLVPLLDKGIVALSIYASPTVINVFNYHKKFPGRLTWAIASKIPQVPPGTHPWKVALEPYLNNDYDRKVMQALLELSDQDDVCFPTPLCVAELPPEDGSGWGGKGRVTLIGDSAHALRPSSGQGGSMAFEDVQVLCRALRSAQDPADYDKMAALVMQVENERLPRVRKIWNMEQQVAELGYVKGANAVTVMTRDYMEWVYQGC